MKTTITIIAAAIALTGCASVPGGHYTPQTITPIIDRQGTDPVKLAQDLEQCNAFARQSAGVGESAAAGAIVGALIGAALMAAAGGNGFRNEAAAVGAISGGLAAGAEAGMSQRQIVSRCMTGRGYRVLN